MPLPTPPKSMEGDVRFLNLEKYPNFFDDLAKGFPRLASGSSNSPGRNLKTLKVNEVGAYEASFVPTIADFERLDPRFRLPPDAWKDIPEYQDYGFAVFKLKKGQEQVHPMAFDFPRRDAKRIFFPTVHIHDGKVHETALFDHLLYLQDPGRGKMLMSPWFESPQPAKFFVNVEQAQSIVLPDEHIYKAPIVGERKNRDTLI